MPAVPAWAYPTQFDLTNPFNGTLSFNVQTASGIYLLIQDGCDFKIGVRSTTDNVPQADGSILHTRFLTGTTIEMTVQLWETLNEIACSGTLLVEMLDELSGALRSLLNAGDNEGRLTWEIAGGNDRMLDDVRLAVYPVFTAGPPPTVTFTIDSEFPYAQDLTESATNSLPASTPTVFNNTGTADYYPVFKVNGATSAFTLSSSTGLQIVYDSTLPGAQAIGGGDYGEINCFRNTMFLNGSGADLMAGIVEDSSEFFPLVVGTQTLTLTGASADVIWAPAWG